MARQRENHSSRYLAFFAWVTLLNTGACSKPGESGTSSSPATETEVGSETGSSAASGSAGPVDREGEAADQPTIVSGAFLVGFGPTGTSKPRIKGDQAGVGISVYQKSGTEKVGRYVAVKKATFYTSDENSTPGTEAAVLPRSATENWNAVVTIPTSTAVQLRRVSVQISVDDSAPITIEATAPVIFNPEALNGNDARTVSSAGEGADSTFLPSTPIFPVSGGGPGAGPGSGPNSDSNAALTSHMMFVTDNRYVPGGSPDFAKGDAGLFFQSVGDANRICNHEANGDDDLKQYWWQAVLSDDDADASARVRLYGPVTTLDGVALAKDAAAFFGTGISASTVTYRNRAVASAVNAEDQVFSGSLQNGTYADGATCKSWTSASAKDKGAVGAPEKQKEWLKTAAAACNKPRRLYCFSYEKRPAAP